MLNTKEEIKADVEAEIKKIGEKVEKGEMTHSEASAFLYGYISQTLMMFIGKFETDFSKVVAR